MSNSTPYLNAELRKLSDRVSAVRRSVFADIESEVISSRATVVASRAGFCTEPTYARQHLELEGQLSNVDSVDVVRMVHQMKSTIESQAARMDEIEVKAERFKQEISQRVCDIQDWINDVREKSIPEVPQCSGDRHGILEG